MTNPKIVRRRVERSGLDRIETFTDLQFDELVLATPAGAYGGFVNGRVYEGLEIIQPHEVELVFGPVDSTLYSHVRGIIVTKGTREAYKLDKPDDE